MTTRPVKPKRILYIHHGGGIGGAPLSLLYLLQQLDRSCYEPLIVTLKPGPVVDLFRAQGFPTDVEPRISDFSHTTLEWYGAGELWRLPGKLLRFCPSIWHARTLIRRLHPDIVHLNSSTLAPVAIASKLEGIPVVWHIREPLAAGYIGLRRWALRHIIDCCATQVIAICRYDASRLISSSRLHVIYNFVDFDRFDRSIDGREVRTDLGVPLDAPLALMLGGVAEPKGTLILIQALPHLLAKLPTARVIIAGPPLRSLAEPGLKGLAKRLLRTEAYHQAVQHALDSLEPHVQAALIFAGLRRDVPSLLAAADCLVFPSVVPHFARPVIEAAAMARPAVASNLGGPDELIVPGQTGLLVPPGDPLALAEAIAFLLTDRAQARAIGEAAYERAKHLFDARANAATTIALYDDLVRQTA